MAMSHGLRPNTDKIRARMEELGRTQAEVSRRVGLSRSSVAMLLQGRQVSPAGLARLLPGLDEPPTAWPDYVLPEDLRAWREFHAPAFQEVDDVRDRT